MPDQIGDDRLGLIFACCHPALALEVRIALTLRYVAGLTTKEIAAAFLIPEPTLAQRLVRAKRKIRESGIHFEVPAAARLTERLASVRTVVYLVFNEGFAATGGDKLIRGELCEEAIWLARLLHTLLPADTETAGLFALLLLHHSRAAARTDSAGTPVPLAEQDRSRWDAALIAEGMSVLDEALARRSPGTYQLQAAIAALHAAAPSFDDTDWPQIALLYGSLARLDPSPVVAVNRSVAVGMADGPLAGLAVSSPCWHPARSTVTLRCTRHTPPCWKKPVIRNGPVVPGRRQPKPVPVLRCARSCSAGTKSLTPGCRSWRGPLRRESMELSTSERAVSLPLVLALTSISFFMVSLDAPSWSPRCRRSTAA